MTLLIVRHLALAGVGTGLLVLFALVVRLLASRDAVLRYRLMVATLLAAGVLLPVQAFTAEMAPAPRPAKVASSLHLAATSAQPASPTATRRESTSLVKRQGVPAAWVTAASRGFARVDWASALLGTYLLVGASLLVFHCVRAIGAQRLIRGATPVTDPRLLRVWTQIIAGTSRPPLLLECDGLHAPACRGLRRPAVIVPTASGSLDAEALAAALRHELIHLQRRDSAVALLTTAMTVVLWFQPLIWVFDRLLKGDREHSCDALVVRWTRRPRSYALALLQFCDPDSSGIAPLIGFESARSIRRRITMLTHALRPATRRRSAAVLGFGLMGLVATSGAHALLVAAAGPGPALSSGDAPAPAPSATGSHQGQEPPRMTAEVRAPEGRTDVDVYQRLKGQGAFGPGVPFQIAKDEPWIYLLPGDPPKETAAPGTWVTDQETVVSVHDARIVGDTLQADSARLILPDGSKLRAVVEGESVRFEPRAKTSPHILVTRGTVRIVDDAGVTRVTVRAASGRDDATLTLASNAESGEFNFRVSADEGAVSIQVDPRTGAPEGEQQPPHGAVRWKLTPQDKSGAGELKMQWIYDLSRVSLPQNDGC